MLVVRKTEPERRKNALIPKSTTISRDRLIGSDKTSGFWMTLIEWMIRPDDFLLLKPDEYMLVFVDNDPERNEPDGYFRQMDFWLVKRWHRQDVWILQRPLGRLHASPAETGGIGTWETDTIRISFYDLLGILNDRLRQ